MHSSVSTVSNVIQLVSFYVQDEDCQNILKVRCRPLAFTTCRVLLRKKKRSGTTLPTSFLVWFLKKNISHVIFCELTKCYCLNWFTWILSNACLVIICFLLDDAINFEINLSFLSSHSPTWLEKLEQNFEYLKNEKKSF